MSLQAAPSQPPARLARLLSLDGGGVKGISTLMILQEIMKQVKDREIKANNKKESDECLPVDYFEIAAGTSTGGLIAVLLFRLNLPVSTAVTLYERMAKDVFTPTIIGMPANNFLGRFANKLKILSGNSQFDDGPLKKTIDTVVETYGLDPNDKQMKGAAPLTHAKAGKLIMCATLAEQGESILFRSYDFPMKAAPVTGAAKDDYFSEIDDIDISTAGRATSAAPTYLPPVVFPEPDKNQKNTKDAGKKGLVFWDGGLLNNNPIDQLWNCRYDLVGPQDPAPGVSLIVSLGCSWNTVKPGYAMKIINTITQVTNFMTNTEAKNRDFKRYIQVMRNRNDQNALTTYERLNTPTDQESFDMADFNKMGELQKLTQTYLDDPTTKEQVTRIADLLVKGGSRARDFKQLLADGN